MKAWSRVQIMKVNGWRTLTATLTGSRDLGVAALGATNKMFWSEHHREVMELALDISGMDAQILGGDNEEDSWPGIQRQRGRQNYPVNPMQASFFFSVPRRSGVARPRSSGTSSVSGCSGCREPKVEERAP